MKLLVCTYCWDVFSLNFEERKCKCGQISGRYIDEANAVFTGTTAVCLGMDNASLQYALMNQRIDGPGVKIDACSIPIYSDATIKMVNDFDVGDYDNPNIKLIAGNWLKEVKKKRSFPYRILYKICKKIIEINLSDGGKDYYSLSEAIFNMNQKLKNYLNDDDLKVIYHLIGRIASKDQEKIKQLSLLPAPEMVRAIDNSYRVLYGKQKNNK